MHYESAILTMGLLLASLATASPDSTPTSSASPPPATPSSIQWQVSNYNQSCTPAVCSYIFHIASPARDIFPSFEADCAGSDQLQDLVRCHLYTSNGTVGAKLLTQTDGSSVLRVNQEFNANITGGKATYWVDGYSAESPGRYLTGSFAISPNSPYAVG